MKKRIMPPTDAEFIAYLLGVSQIEISDVYDKFHVKQNIAVRKLCSLRSAIFLNYSEIESLFSQETPLCEIQKVSRMCTDLTKEGITVEKKQTLLETIVGINKMIADYIDKPLESRKWNEPIPLWMIKSIFVSSDGYTTDGVKNQLERYRRFTSEYPYQKFLNWDFTVSCDAKQLLVNPKQFFAALKTVCSPSSKSDILNEFLEKTTKAAVIVDCENSDPMKLYTTVVYMGARINKVVLIDDARTSLLWGWVESHLKESGTQVERIEIERLKEQKSLVDLAMATRTMTEFYESQIDSFLLVTSDSDIWALISSLPKARFMVLPEERKCGEVLIKTLSQKDIPLIYLEDISKGQETVLLDRLICAVAEDMAAKWVFDAKKAIYSAAQQLMITTSTEDVERCAKKVVEKLTIEKTDSTVFLTSKV